MSRLEELREKYRDVVELDPFPYAAVSGGALRFSYGPPSRLRPRVNYEQDRDRYELHGLPWRNAAGLGWDVEKR